LPWALGVAAARAAAHPRLRMATLAAELRDARSRLDALETGEPASNLRTVLSWSYRNLDGPAARLFRLLGLHPGPDVTTPAAASLAAVSLDDAHGLLRELSSAHLLAEHTPGRYAFHDLLHAYAAEQARACDTDGARQMALGRLFDYYLGTAATAMDTLVPAERHHRPHITAQSAVPIPRLVSPDAARAWLDAERATLVALTGYMAANGWPGDAIRLAVILFRYLHLGGYYMDAAIVSTHALHAAHQTGDVAAQADALRNLGVVNLWQGRYGDAAHAFQQALASFAEVGKRLGQARVHNVLGLALYRQGQYQQADNHLQLALGLFREHGDRFAEAAALDNLGLVLCRQGRYQQAAGHHRQAQHIYRTIGDRDGEANVLNNLGVVLCRQGRYQRAADCHRQALGLYRELGQRDGEAEALYGLGVALCQQGCYVDAADHHSRALDLYRELGSERGQTDALNGLGETLCAAGQVEQARAQHQEAVQLAVRTDDRYEQARAHNGLACTYHTNGNLDKAYLHWQRALALYAGLGVPEAGRLRKMLTAVTAGP
jgi:tetratricopeptide (TPR) repeat protein